MARPDSTALSITPAALRLVVEHAVYAKKNGYGEACGFVFGAGGVGRRVVAIANVHPKFEHHFAMDADGILKAMAEADTLGEDIVAVYHSHPTTAAIPSLEDASTPDHGPAYLIVGWPSPADEDHPSCRAWRFDLEYIGQPRSTEVLLHVSEDGEPFAATPPIVPWALTQGNKVLLTYQRPGHDNRRTITAEITAVEPGSDPQTYPGKVTLRLNPRQGTDPKSMLVERIKAVRVLRESPQAARVRQRTATYGRALAHCVEGDQFTQTAKYGSYVTAAFPSWLAHVEES